MVYFTVKEIKKQLHIRVKFDSFQAFEEQFVNRLAPLSKRTALSAFFYLPSLSDAETIAFFKLCKKSNIQLLGINYEEPSEQLNIVYQEGNIRSGQSIVFDKPSFVFGSLRSSAKVTSTGSISIFGEVSGMVDLLHAENVLFAARLKKARVRIADSIFEEFNQDHPCKIFYENQQLKCISVL